MPFIRHKPFNICDSDEHEPGQFDLINLKPGVHTWKCPKCGRETTITIPRPVRYRPRGYRDEKWEITR